MTIRPCLEPPLVRKLVSETFHRNTRPSVFSKMPFGLGFCLGLDLFIVSYLVMYEEV